MAHPEARFSQVDDEAKRPKDDHLKMDYALLKSGRDFEYTDKVRPACLPPSE